MKIKSIFDWSFPSKFLFVVIVAFIAFTATKAMSQNVTVTAPLSPEQKTALKTLLAISVADTNSPFFGQTNLSVGNFATNYATLQMSDVVTEVSRNRRNAIAGQLAGASDDTLTAIEAVLKWSNATDLSRNQANNMTNVIRLLPLATAAKMNSAATALQ